jgi:hypothetical protein
MKVALATLCDAATEWCGKLFIVGTFDTINSPQFPAVHPACAVVVSLRFEAIEEGEHRIKARLVNEDGKLIADLPEAKPTIIAQPTGRPVSVNYMINLQQMQLPAPGEYSFDVAVDGKHESSIPLFVQQLNPPFAKAA